MQLIHEWSIQESGFRRCCNSKGKPGTSRAALSKYSIHSQDFDINIRQNQPLSMVFLEQFIKTLANSFLSAIASLSPSTHLSFDLFNDAAPNTLLHFRRLPYRHPCVRAKCQHRPSKTTGLPLFSLTLAARPGFLLVRVSLAALAERAANAATRAKPAAAFSSSFCLARPSVAKALRAKVGFSAWALARSRSSRSNNYNHATVSMSKWRVCFRWLEQISASRMKYFPCAI